MFQPLVKIASFKNGGLFASLLEQISQILIFDKIL